MASTQGPITSLHYTANGVFVNGVYTPAADGFNLADVGSADMLNYLPAGIKGLVYVGMTDGVTAAFTALVDACKGNPNLYGFYLADEPDASATTAANLKAEADYIHANLPGAETFMVEQNLSSNTTPSYYYTPANTDIDLFGLDPYPVQTNVPNNLDYNIIPLAVAEAEKVGIPLADIVPTYQAFGGGGYSTYILPTAAQEEQILATWASVVPTPAFDYTYSWGSQNSDTALSEDPALQAVFAAHNAGGTTATPPAAPTITSPAASSTDTTTATPKISGGGVTGDTVTVSIDGTVAGTATVANSAWTFAPSSALSNGSHAITATQAAAGGPSSAAASDSFTVNIATPPAAPTLTIADTSLSVDGGGGTVDLGIGVSAPSAATDVTVAITGLRRFETISDGLGDTFHGKSITLTEAQVDSGLTLTSNYTGSRDPVTTLQIMASDSIDGVTSSSASQTITVTDPPASTSSGQGTNRLALLSQYMAGDTSGGSSGALQTASAPTESDRSSFLLSVLRH